LSSALPMPVNTAAFKTSLPAVLTGIGRADDKDYEPHRRMVRAVMGPTLAPR